MRLREKLLLSFLIPVIVLGLIALTSLSWTYNNFDSVITSDNLKVQSVLMMTVTNHRALQHILKYVMFNNKSDLNGYRNNLIKFDFLLNKYRQLKLTNIERQYLASEKTYFNKLTKNTDTLIKLVQKKEKLFSEAEEKIIDLNVESKKIISIYKGNNKPFIVQLQRINSEVNKNFSDTKSYILYQQLTLKNQITINAQNILKSLDLLKESVNNKAVDQLVGDYNSFLKLIASLPTLKDEKISALNQTIFLSSNIENILEKNIISEAEKESALNRNRIATLNSSVIAVISIVLLLSIVLTWWFATRFILNPIQKIKSVADAVAKGDVNNPVDYFSADEFGDLAKSFRRLVKNTYELANIAKSLGEGNFDTKITPRSEDDLLAYALIDMRSNLQKLNSVNKQQVWEKTQVATITQSIQGVKNLQELLQLAITQLSSILDVGYSAFFLKEDNNEKIYLRLRASYAYSDRKNLSNCFEIGEGLVGQCALEQKVISITNIPDDYVKVTSGLGEEKPTVILAVPVMFEQSLVGVFEFAAFHTFTQQEEAVVKVVSDNLGIIISNVLSHEKTEELLKKYQELAEQLKMQKEELRSTNEQLEEKAKILKESEEELKAQSEELQVSNEELEEKTERLEQQNKDIERKNIEIEKSRTELERRAKDLSLASKYKSEFLANMSHELRTPLNSLLILSKNLSQNKSGNLNEKQVESAKVIYKGGNDLLLLINDILDLSKVEAGKLEVYPEEVDIRSLVNYLKQQFLPLVNEKNLKFITKISDALPKKIITDEQRLTQIIRNLLSNAIKFTEKGSVSLLFDESNEKDNYITISVEDTGIGIPDKVQKAIFEAFQQADGSTSRKYGGTGLGLAITKAMTKLLEGDINVTSIVGKGSTFKISLPYHMQDVSNQSDNEEDNSIKQGVSDKREKPQTYDHEIPAPLSFNSMVNDDRDQISESDKSVLIVEDDPEFAKILIEMARNNGFLCVSVSTGLAALEMANRIKPKAIILDLGLPDISGKEVLEKLKKIPCIKDVPVHIISACDESDMKGISKFIIGYLPKPATTDKILSVFKKFESEIAIDMKKVLIVEDNEASQKALQSLISDGEIEIDASFSASSARKKIIENSYDCIILDLTLPDYSGLELLKKLTEEKIAIPPVIVYTSDDLSESEHIELQRYTTSILLKNDKSSERLRDEVMLFLHAIEDKLEINLATQSYHSNNNDLSGKKVLVVDDDMRNVFALSNTLEEYGIEVIIASNGKLAVEKINQEKTIDLVLMDIMMPIMDGFEAIKIIRQNDDFASMPIIALTAKAMPGDKEKCIEVGASDYITKPVNIDQLISMIKLWLFK